MKQGPLAVDYCQQGPSQQMPERAPLHLECLRTHLIFVLVTSSPRLTTSDGALWLPGKEEPVNPVVTTWCDRLLWPQKTGAFTSEGIRLKGEIALVPRESVCSPPVVSIASISESSCRRTTGG